MVKGGRKLRSHLIKASNNKTATVKVGFLDGSTFYENGQNVPTVASFNEFGTTKSPARPFFSASVIQSENETRRIVKKGLKKKQDNKQTLSELGKSLQEAIQLNIVDWSEPPNAPSTVARKGFNDPLIETGKMFDSVEYKVSDGN